MREVTDVQVGEEMEAPATEVANQEEGVVQGNVTVITKATVWAQTAATDFSQSWRMEVRDQGDGQLGSRSEPASRLAGGAF